MPRCHLPIRYSLHLLLWGLRESLHQADAPASSAEEADRPGTGRPRQHAFDNLRPFLFPDLLQRAEGGRWLPRLLVERREGVRDPEHRVADALGENAG